MTGVSRRVVITGLGALCALGDNPEQIYAALCDGRAGFAPPTVFPADAVPGHVVAEIKDFAPQKYLGEKNIRPLDRTGRLAAVGVDLALADAQWPAAGRRERGIGLILGTMFCSVRTIGEFDRRAQSAGPEYASPLDFSNTVLNAAAGQVAIWQGLPGVNTTIASGSVSGLHAIGYAATLIRTGRASVLVAGGVEEVCFESCFGFQQAGLLATPSGAVPGCAVPFDARRTGTALGEGAAFLVLEDEDVAKARGARILGYVEGLASAYDPRSEAEQGSAVGLTYAITRALADAGITAAEIGAVASSASGSRVQDAREAAAIRATIGAKTPVTAVKSMLGETLGASGALSAMAMIQSLGARRLPGIAGLTSTDVAIGLAVAPGVQPIGTSRGLVTAVAPEGNCDALVLGIE